MVRDYYNRNNTRLTDMDYRLGKNAKDYPDEEIHISYVWSKTLHQLMYVVWFWACTGIDYIPYQVSEHDTYAEAYQAMIDFEESTKIDIKESI